MADVAAAHGIDERTGRRWARERELMGTLTAMRCVGKPRAAAKGHKLGRPFRVDKSILEDLVSTSNPVAEQPLAVQARHHNIPLAERLMEYNLTNRVDSQMYVAAYTQVMRDANYTARTTYGEDNQGKELFGFWDTIYFTDEAHFNPTERFQRQRILRRKGNRERQQRLVKQRQRKDTG
ncbi:hypothetical protein K458DRAFT_453903 [Lentithecium fluviatile CBS 122367]|uniref:Uncharacterized protein n=1 Tax=Lentithecium fluviatile CBS 122367 TaxID=1168545 RepID=A0A6G1IXQ9_9PLEO|nr:hypothetical protein K458DRAFT_453903 [Lentithecium fluviatile CBS 122367]